MQIIWDRQAAIQLKNSHTVLELETFFVNGESITAYCVVPAEKIFPEIHQLETSVELHQAFVCAFNDKNYQLCQDIAPSLTGKFGGELDSFYETLLNKINNDNTGT
jgi:NAD-dependent SIR2 family protein deacetylase